MNSENQKITGGLNPLIINQDTTFTVQKTYQPGTKIIVRDNAHVIWQMGVTFKAGCQLIIESGEVYFQNNLQGETSSDHEIISFNLQIKGGKFKSSGSETKIPDNSEIIITGGELVSQQEFQLGNGCRMTLENSKAKFELGVNFGDENILQIIDSVFEVSAEVNLNMGKKSVLDARRGQLYLTGATVFLGDRSLLELSDYQVKGGHFIGAFKHLRQNNSKDFCYQGAFFSAPIKKVFDLDASFEGRWIMDAAYPQWFYDAITVLDKNVTREQLDRNPKSKSTVYEVLPDQVDWSVAINKAIEFKGSGEVHLPAGYYPIQQSIIMLAGIVLKGVGDCWNTEVYYKENGEKHYPGNDGGTYLMPTMTKATWVETEDGSSEQQTISGYVNRFLFNCSVIINVKPEILKNKAMTDKELGDFIKYSRTSDFKAMYNEVWEGSYIKVSTMCQTFSISNDTHPESRIRRHKGIFVAGGAQFEGLRFDAVQQSIVWSDDYADNKNVRHCYTSSAEDFHRKRQTGTSGPIVSFFGEPEILYAYDMGRLGDAMTFESNQVETGYQNALRINSCGGGRVASNTLNADVRIENSKGISFSYNHMGNSPQVRIVSSSVIVQGNYLIRGKRPNILIVSQGDSSGSVVSLIQNQYGFNEPEAKEHISQDTDTVEIGEYEIGIGISNVNEKIENLNIIDITNEFRYWMKRGLTFGSTMPTGIQVCEVNLPHDENGAVDIDGEVSEESYVGLDEFNLASHYLSIKSQILPGNKIMQGTYDRTDLGLPSIGFVNLQSGAWRGAIGYYLYAYRISYLYTRGVCDIVENPLKLTVNDQETPYNVTPICTDKTDIETGIQYVDKDSLVLFKCHHTEKPFFNNYLLTMIRIPCLHTVYDDGSFGYTPMPEWAKYAHIPVCGTPSLYDNGFSINGYQWKEYTEEFLNDPDLIIPDCGLNNNISRVKIIESNAKIYIDEDPYKNTNTPDTSNASDTPVKPVKLDLFKQGDEFINTNINPDTDTDNNSWIIKIVK